jgi:hypothetical protein
MNSHKHDFRAGDSMACTQGEQLDGSHTAHVSMRIKLQEQHAWHYAVEMTRGTTVL